MRRILFFLFFFSCFFSPDGTFAAPQKNDVTPQTVTLQTGPLSHPLSLEKIQQWNRHETVITVDPSYRSEWENPDACLLSPFVCATLSERKKPSQKITTTLFVQHEKIRAYLEDLQKQSNRDSTISTVAPRENSALYLFTRGQTGIRLSVEKNIPVLESLVEHFPTLPEKPIALETELGEPTLSSEAQQLGLTTLLAEGTSNFSGSSTSRIFNITHALERFDALLLKPGEEFSFTNALGPVDESTGYRQELVIRKNATEMEYGGGICQVSTTFFRAAVNAGLEILERHNHSYPVRYYTPIGFDATVYYPRPDLRIRNNYTHNILFAPTVSGKTITFSVYGTPDARTIDVTTPTILERKPDGSIKTQFTQTVRDAKGNTIVEETFPSFYDSPDKYPHPSDIALTEKPKDWSKKQWEAYQKSRGA